MTGYVIKKKDEYQFLFLYCSSGDAWGVQGGPLYEWEDFPHVFETEAEAERVIATERFRNCAVHQVGLILFHNV